MLGGKRKTSNLVLYSTNTWLAYNIAERYFKGEHYVWCTPYFDVVGNHNYQYTVAPTSSPKHIYVNLYIEATGRDLHSGKIKDNKFGILKGAALKRSEKVITEQEEAEINAIIETAQTIDFRPLLYIIPYDKVTTLMKNVPILERANPLSTEYIIDKLPRNLFDVIEIKWD